MPALASDQSGFNTEIDVFFDGTEVEDADIISFVVERDLGQPDMAVITLRNDHHKHTRIGVRRSPSRSRRARRRVRRSRPSSKAKSSGSSRSSSRGATAAS